MSDILVLGGGLCGLGTAMMLAKDGHDVTVVERDPEGPPASVDDAVQTWDRSGVGQFRLAHYMHPRFRHIVQTELPEVFDALVRAGGLKYDTLKAFMPETIEDRSPREGDEKFWTLTGRRPMLELVFAQAAEDTRGVKVERGVHVTGLVTNGEVIPGVPHVVGARTANGDELRADLVIDAMGRRSELPQWLSDLGYRPPQEEAEDCGFIYYGREFRSRDGSLPEQKGPLLAPVGTISVLALPADNDTWIVTFFTAAGDQPMKQLRFEDKWTKVARSLPLYEHWLDGEPISDVMAMAGIMDRYRRFVVDGVPVVSGLLPVADAWASTNPSLGRGISLGLMHAQRLRDLVRKGSDPKSMPEEWDAITEADLTPWYQFQIQFDRARVAEIDALRQGKEPVPDEQAQMLKAFQTATFYDPDLYRGFVEIGGCLATPEDVLGRPGMFEKMIAAADGRELPPIPGPNREELLALLA